MSCYRPLKAHYRPGAVPKLGTDPHGDARVMEWPCGRCIGCKLDHARMWSIRITHEAQLYDSNLFLTLTYDQEHLPPSLGLEYDDYRGFMKRLRARLRGVSEGPDGRRPIRFFVAGEYGGRTGRPHWHAILFNVAFPDSEKFQNGTLRSQLCEDLWQRGNVVIGAVNSRSAAYVAGYTLKKARGRRGEDYYEDTVNPVTGEIGRRRREFVVMSRKPGIGAWWYARFGADLFPVDHAVMEGRQHKVPRYYWERYKLEADGAKVDELQHKRYLRAMEHRCDSTPERRAVREEVAEARSKMFGERGL